MVIVNFVFAFYPGIIGVAQAVVVLVLQSMMLTQHVKHMMNVIENIGITVNVIMNFFVASARRSIRIDKKEEMLVYYIII